MAETADPSIEHRQNRYEAPPGATEILLVRHGESAPFRPGLPFDLVDGHGNPHLAPGGEEQAVLVGERLRHETIHAVYATKLTRTSQTAAPLAAHLGLEINIDPDLHEIFLGDWEGGLLRQKAAEEHPIVLEMRAKQEWGVIPNAETVAQLTDRCVRGITRICAAHRDQRVAVFVHGGVIGALCAFATGSQAFAFAGANNGSIHHLVIDGPEWILRCFNDSAHLGPFTTAAQALT